MRVTFKILTIAILGLSGTISRADVFVPAGLNPGDQYHIAFVTDGGIDAVSFNISTYNDFAVAQAALNPSLTGTDMGVSYSAIASTPGANAFENALVQAPVYLLDSTLVASGISDMWDGSLNSPIDLDQFGQLNQMGVWTGTNSLGTGFGDSVLGGPFGLSQTGIAGVSDHEWISFSQATQDNPFSIYALSEVLTVSIPEPTATGSLLGLSMLLIGRRRSRNKSAFNLAAALDVEKKIYA